MKLTSPGAPKHREIAAVQGEDRPNLFPIRQVYQRRVRKLYFQTPILGENCGDSFKIIFIDDRKLERLAVKRGQQPLNCQRIVPKQPSRFSDYGPTSQEPAREVLKLLDANRMVFVGL